MCRLKPARKSVMNVKNLWGLTADPAELAKLKSILQGESGITYPILMEEVHCTGSNVSSDIDSDNDGYTVGGGDCDNSKPSVYPGAPEICADGIDQDCNGSDKVCPPDPSDTDNDGDGYSENQGDCNDFYSNIHPGSYDICGDGIDQDCSGGDASCTTTCCKICTTGKACGDSCISNSYTCHQPPGCACNG